MNKQGNQAVNLLKNNAIFIIGILLLTYKAFFLNSILDFNKNIMTVIYMISISALFMSPTINTKKKFSYIYLNVVYGIATLIIYADYLYYTYSTNFISFYQIENLQYAKEIGTGLTCIINLKNMAMFWFDNIIMLILSIIIYKKTQETELKSKKGKIITIILILAVNIIFICTQVNDRYVSRIYNKSLIVQDISAYYYHLGDFRDYICSLFMKEKVDEEKLKPIYNQLEEEKAKETEYTGIAKDKNVIIVQMESLNEYVINKTVNGKEITPNLNKFFKENIYCSDMYNQGLGSTADSEFEMANSMYPLENGYVFQKYSQNQWRDIYTTLKNSGYYTSFMHPNTSTYWNREEVYKAGYHIDEYNDIKKFPNIASAGEFYSDEDFFVEAVNYMANYDKKFCSTLVSVTTHIPFYLDGIPDLESKLSISFEDMEQYGDETFKRYLISCNFNDYAFGKLLESLEEKQLLDKTILVVYGDHGAALTQTDEIIKLYKENNCEYTNFEDITKDRHVPYGMKVPGIDEHIEISSTTSKIDIKPTILDLLGEDDKFSMGNSIFSKKDVTFIKGLGYITSKNYWLQDKYYDRKTNQEIAETEELKKLSQKMQDVIYLSDVIIKNNLMDLK